MSTSTTAAQLPLAESTSTTSATSVIPCKRPRTDSDSDADDARTMAMLSETSTLSAAGPSTSASISNSSAISNMVHLVRDPKYYFHDGSIVFRVEDTLFKVHQTIMSRDNSLFSTMFSLPQCPTSVPDGTSDATALLLPGESVHEFRDFLWAMYALPHELLSVHSPQADLDRLIHIANKASRYGFKSIETWALDAIQDLVTRKPCPILLPLNLSASHSSSSATSTTSTSTSTSTSTPHPTHEAITSTGLQLTRLVRLAQNCAHTKLLDTLVKLLTSLMTLSLQFAYLAISLADDLDLRALRGAAYLEIMHKDAVVVYRAPGLSVFSAPASPLLSGPGPGPGAAGMGSVSLTTPALQPGDVDSSGRLLITPAQQTRLLMGYYHLTTAWERTRTQPPTFEHAPSCGATWHQHGCTQSWLEFWKEKTKADAILSLGLADALGRLRVIQKEFDRWGSATYMHHDCRQAARRALGEKVKAIEGALPDYFSDEGPMRV